MSRWGSKALIRLFDLDLHVAHGREVADLPDWIGDSYNCSELATPARDSCRCYPLRMHDAFRANPDALEAAHAAEAEGVRAGRWYRIRQRLALAIVATLGLAGLVLTMSPALLYPRRWARELSCSTPGCRGVLDMMGQRVRVTPAAPQ
jgi:hypothetical protein